MTSNISGVGCGVVMGHLYLVFRLESSKEGISTLFETPEAGVLKHLEMEWLSAVMATRRVRTGCVGPVLLYGCRAVLCSYGFLASRAWN